MNSVIVVLREIRRTSSGAEKSIIEYIIEHPEAAAELSIRELAEQSFVSASTISRLCHKAGYPSYKAFQKALVYESISRKEEVTKDNCEIEEDDNSERIIDKIAFKSIRSLDDTRNLTSTEMYDHSVDAMFHAERIAFFGMGASLLVAQDAYMKFLRINKPCIVNQDLHSQYVTAKNMSSRDAAVIVSYSGITEEMNECAEIMKDAHVPLIAITGYQESPLSKLADYNLYITPTEFEFVTGKLGSRLSQLMVIDTLYALYVQRDYDNCMQTLKHTYIRKGKERE